MKGSREMLKMGNRERVEVEDLHQTDLRIKVSDRSFLGLLI